MKDSNLTLTRLYEVLDYRPETGLFIWKINTGKRRMAGKQAGCKMVRGYHTLSIDRIQYTAHRVAWFYMTGDWPPDDIDHINGVRTDNRFCNLRLATKRDNSFNKGPLPSNKSG